MKRKFKAKLHITCTEIWNKIVQQASTSAQRKTPAQWHSHNTRNAVSSDSKRKAHWLDIVVLAATGWVDVQMPWTQQQSFLWKADSAKNKQTTCDSKYFSPSMVACNSTAFHIAK